MESDRASRIVTLAAIQDPPGRNSSTSPDGVAVNRGWVANISILFDKNAYLLRPWGGTRIDLRQTERRLTPSGRELELANEIHGSSVDALQLEARALQSQLSGAIHHPLNGVLPLLIVPLITIIIRSLKKPTATSAPAAATAPEQKSSSSASSH